MKSWAEMSGGARGGVVAGVAAVIAALFYGAWSVGRPPVDAVTGAVSATGSGEAEAAPDGEDAPAPLVADGVAASESGAEIEPEAEGAGGVAEGAASETVTEAAPEAGVETDDEASGEASVDATVDAGDGAASEAADDAAGAAATEAATAPIAAVVPPSFDLVRVEKDGSALVAGSAMPDVMLSLRVTGQEIAAVPADGQGNFVAMFNLAPSAAPRVLTLVMRMADGTEVPAEGTVVIAPTVAPVVVAGVPGGQVGAEPVAEGGAVAGLDPASDPAPDSAPAVAGEGVAEAVPEAQAPAALLVTEEGAKVLQSASDLPPELVANVTIDTITYTPKGAVQLAGRGTPERVVRLYLDNAPLIEAAISAAGDWAVTLPDVVPGIYTLRADQVDATGAVTSRFETPFKRETVEALAAVADGAAAEGVAGTGQADAPAQGADGADAGAETGAETGADTGADTGAEVAPAPVSVTVQPGFTLWQIATERLGAGTRYVQVFEANRDQIRDPDLIYPGQVFAIPQAE